MVLSESVQTFIKKIICIHISSLLIDTTTCGTTKDECNQKTSPSPSSTSTSTSSSPLSSSTAPSNTRSPSALEIIFPIVFIFAGILMASVFVFCVVQTKPCQSRNTRTYTPPIPQSQCPNQQQFVQQRGHLQPSAPSVNRSAHTNAATPIYNNVEQLLPSYEAVIRDTRFMYPPPSAPMRDVP